MTTLIEKNYLQTVLIKCINLLSGESDIFRILSLIVKIIDKLSVLKKTEVVEIDYGFMQITICNFHTNKLIE